MGRTSISLTAAQIKKRRDFAIDVEERAYRCKPALSARTGGNYRGSIIKGETIQGENPCSDAAYPRGQPDVRSYTALSGMTLDCHNACRDGRPESLETTRNRRLTSSGVRTFIFVY